MRTKVFCPKGDVNIICTKLNIGGATNIAQIKGVKYALKIIK